jgi:hypothetical protein
MKKVLLTGSLLFAILFGASAQTYLVPKAGLTISTFVPADNKENVSSMAGFSGGVGVNLTLNEKFSVQPELLFIQKGANYEFEQPIGDGILETVSTDVRVNYLELPVLAKYTFGNGKLKYFINVGPALSYGLGGKTDYSLKYTLGNETVYRETAEGSVNFGDYPAESPAQDVYFQKRVDVSVQAGGGLIIYDKILIDIRYGHGFIKLDDEAQPKNRSVQFTVGVPLYSILD